MRLGTVNAGGGREIVAQVDGEIVSVTAADPGLGGSIQQLLQQGEEGLGRVQRALQNPARRMLYKREQLGPAVADPGKILCIGKNYAEHAAELGSDIPTKPEVFLRTRTSLAGPYEPVRRPRVSEQMDYEVELGVVIGRAGRYISEARALEHVAGYCVFNDISIRDFQRFGQQWTPGKNFDRSGPLGPFLVTRDEIPDPQDLGLSTTVRTTSGEEEVLQQSHTSLMVYPVVSLIEFLSSFTTLEPGDLIATGTPGGVGDGRRPPRWLRPGETVICRVEGIGN